MIVRKVVVLGAVTAGLLMSQASVAIENGGVTVKAGTLGFGAEYLMPVNDIFSARFGANVFNFDYDFDESGVSYLGELELKTLSAIADYHPWGGVFRLSGGLMYNGNGLSIDAEPSNGKFEFNDVDYNAADVGSASGEIEFNSVSPYLGIGWGMSPAGDGKLSLSVDLGVLYHGKPKASLSVVCGKAINAALCTRLEQDVAAEQTQLEDKISDAKWYPVMSMGFTYRF